jgi:Domain of unknown function (DUF4337)
MALGDAILKQLSKNADKVGDGDQPTSMSSKLKNKAALIISIFAAIYSVDAFIGSQISSKILNNTIHVNDVWNFYQAKSIKQMVTEYSKDIAIRDKDTSKIAEMQALIDRYESDPKTGEGKKELLVKAKSIEAEIDHLKRQSPWIGLAGSIMQISIVLITASMLSAGMMMFWGGILAQVVALAIMGQGLFLWFAI